MTLGAPRRPRPGTTPNSPAGPHVAVWRRQRTTIRSTGRSFSEDLVHIWSFDEAGAIVRLRDIQDSWAIATALGH